MLLRTVYIALFLSSSIVYAVEVTSSFLIGPRHLVVGGVEAEANRYPYYAVIVRAPNFCGGVVVHDDIILSSAHCVLLAVESREDTVEDIVANGAIPRNLRVVIDPSTSDKFLLAEDEDDGLLRITEVLLHPNFGFLDPALHRTEHDLVLYRVNTTAPLAAASLNTDRSLPTPGQGVVTVLGYGATAPDGGDDAEVLQQADLTVVAPDVCEAWYSTIHDADLDICTIGQGGRNACFGDSGGPLVLQGGDGDEDDRVVGIVIHGPEEVIGSNATDKCGDPKWPVVYARVSAYTDWIESAICNMSQSPPASCMEDDADHPPDPSSDGTEEASDASSTNAMTNVFELLAFLLLLLTLTNKAL